MELTVATLNCWSGLTYKGIFKMGYIEPHECFIKRKEALLSALSSSKAQVIFLNELNPSPAFIKRIAAVTDMDYIYHLGLGGLRCGAIGFPINLRESDGIFARKNFGLKNLKRVSLLRTGFCLNFFSCHFSDHTQAVLGSIKIDDKLIYLCCVHLHATPDYRYINNRELEELSVWYGFPKKEVAKTVNALKKDANIKELEIKRLISFLQQYVPNDAPLILAGDFNAHKSWPQLTPLKKFGLIDVYDFLDKKNIYPTWDPSTNENLKTYYTNYSKAMQKSLYDQLHALDELKPRVIDYIFVKNLDKIGGKIKSVKLIYKENLVSHNGVGFPISDHFGVEATLSISN